MAVSLANRNPIKDDLLYVAMTDHDREIQLTGKSKERRLAALAPIVYIMKWQRTWSRVFILL